MENGYENFGTQDILTGRGLGLYGFNGYSGGTLDSLARADGTALKEGQDCNRALMGTALDRVSDQAEETRRILQNDNIRGIITDGQLENAILNGQRDVSMADRLNDIKFQQAQCCCETQKLIFEENNKTRDLINAQALKTAEREIDVLRGQANTQEIIRAICCGCGGPGNSNRTSI